MVRLSVLLFFASLLLIQCDYPIVLPITPPTANFSFENDNCIEPCDVPFTNLSEDDSTYKWYVDNVFVSDEENPVINFQTFGTYTVKLVVSGQENYKDSITKSVMIQKNTTWASQISSGGLGFDGGYDLLLSGSTYFIAGYRSNSLAIFKLNSKGKEVGLNIYDGGKEDARIDILSNGKLVLVSRSSISNAGTGSNSTYAYLVDSTSLSPDASTPAIKDNVSMNDIFISGNDFIYIVGENNDPRVFGGFNEGVFFYFSPTLSSSNPKRFLDDKLGKFSSIKPADIYTIPDDYFVCGSAQPTDGSSSFSDIILTKISKSGSLRLGPLEIGVDNKRELSSDLEFTNDGEILILGNTFSSPGVGEEPYLALVDGQLNVIDWLDSFGMFGTNEEANDMEKTSDGGFVIVGNSEAPGSDSNIFLAKVNIISNQIQIDWIRSNESKGYDNNGNDDYGNRVKETEDGGFIIVGTTKTNVNNSDVYVLKTNENGIVY